MERIHIVAYKLRIRLMTIRINREHTNGPFPCPTAVHHPSSDALIPSIIADIQPCWRSYTRHVSATTRSESRSPRTAYTRAPQYQWNRSDMEL
jgi:hypothetical protein